jgi:preprotein translocase subunit SecE
MKLNWKLFKVVLAFVVIFGTIAWALSSLLPSSYSGSNLNFGVGSGPVTVTNPSDEPVPVQLVAPRSRSFTVASAAEGLAGSSTRQGTGSSSTYVFEFDLPPGISEFTIARGADVKFMADSATRLEARINPLNPDSTRTTIIVAAVVILGALFYASNAVGHQWINFFRREVVSTPEPQPTTASRATGQDYGQRPYGDNRADQTN